MIQKTTSTRDPILDEIHQTRQHMAEKFGGDITAILDDARQRQAASTHPTWKGPSTAQSSTPTGNKPVG
jgi:hypothetical protein